EGLRAVNLGPNTPVPAMQQAFAFHQPRLVWISASSVLAPERAAEIANWLVSLPTSTLAVVGGRECGPILAAQPSVRHLRSMGELAVLAAELRA
ncbi:MAG: hypothetical protein H0T79_19065, partial [Deltaproteobacteria bacterium]|nr:hypothetical protein [Deltaproteobacteria bacterium]